MKLCSGEVIEVRDAGNQDLSTIRIKVKGQNQPLIISMPRAVIRSVFGELASTDEVDLNIEVTKKGDDSPA